MIKLTSYSKESMSVMSLRLISMMSNLIPMKLLWKKELQ